MLDNFAYICLLGEGQQCPFFFLNPLLSFGPLWGVGLIEECSGPPALGSFVGIFLANVFDA